jgi:hypothetical protein
MRALVQEVLAHREAHPPVTRQYACLGPDGGPREGWRPGVGEVPLQCQHGRHVYTRNRFEVRSVVQGAGPQCAHQNDFLNIPHVNNQ